jgi:hypothetical protein
MGVKKMGRREVGVKKIGKRMEWGQRRWEVERNGGELDGKQIGTEVKMT